MISNKDVEYILRIFLIKNKIYEDFKNGLSQASFYGSFNTIESLCEFLFSKKVYLNLINSFRWDCKRHNLFHWMTWDEKYNHIIQKFLNEGKLVSNLLIK
jgi:hypothetical protein